MNNKTGARKIEDLGETILSFAETKALACSNPLIMEKFKVDKHIQQLQILEKAFKEQQMIAFRRKKDFQYKQTEYSQVRDKLIIDVEFAKQTEGRDFIINIDNINYSERVAAGEKLVSYLDELKVTYTQELMERSMKVGEYRGFDLMYKLSKDVSTGRLVKILGIKHTKFNSVQFSISPLGLITRIENRVKGLAQTVDTLEKNIKQIQESIQMADEELNKKFNRAEELSDLLDRQNAINKELNINCGADISGIAEEEAV